MQHSGIFALDKSCKAVLKEAGIDVKHETKHESYRELERDSKKKQEIMKEAEERERKAK